MMESRFLPRSTSQRNAEQLSCTEHQVHEPAAMPIVREKSVDVESAEWSSAHCTAADVELIVHLGLLDFEGHLIDWKTELEIDLTLS